MNYKDINVYDAARERLNYIFDNFNNVMISFSGGKDSGVMLNLAYEVAIERDETDKLAMYTMDYEADYIQTEKYVSDVFNKLFSKIKRKYWLCLPISAQCAVSMHQTFWTPWDKNKKDIWVKPMPDNDYVVNEDNVSYHFEKNTYGAAARKQFVKEFAKKNGKTAILVGLRGDESLSRHAIITSQHRSEMFNNVRYSKKESELVYNFYPIYDWKAKDIWTANAKFNWEYNSAYDLMYYSGMTINQMRIASPFHSSGTQSLRLYQALSPETWGKMISRVNGVNFTAIYGGTAIMAYKSIQKPDKMTWQEYGMFLINTLPKDTKQYFLDNMKRIEKTWSEDGHGRNPEVIAAMEREGAVLEHTGEVASNCTKPKYYEIVKLKNGFVEESEISMFRKVPSWKGVCVTILKNDFTMQYMGVSRSKKMLAKRKEAIRKYEDIL